MERYRNAIFKSIIMAITISQIDEQTIRVNDKIVYKDSNNKWIAQVQLSPSEHKEFSNHLKAIGEPLIE